MSRRAALTITQADLQAAYTLRRRPSWPATFEAAMADPLVRHLVRAEALGRAQALQTHACHPPQSPVQRLRQLITPAAPRPAIDRKRAAAGDRDDD